MIDESVGESELLERYETILMNIQDAVYTLDAEGRITWVNEPAVENYELGYTRDDLIGSYVSKVLSQDDIEKALEIIQNLLTDDDRERGRCEIVVQTANGKEIPFDLHLTLLPFDDGEFQGTLGVLRDIRERKLREQRLEVFNRVLRHNVRNDMAVILGQAEDIQRLVGGRAAEKAALIHQQGLHLNNLAEKARTIEEVLDGQDYVVEPVDVQEIARERVKECRIEYPQATIEFRDKEQHWALANETLGLALDELLENAFQHTDAPVHISVSLTTKGDENESVSITVEDNGTRIPTGEINALQAGGETQLDHSSGLGLWVVKWLVDRFGGSLSFEQSESGGNAVTISLPKASSKQ